MTYLQISWMRAVGIPALWYIVLPISAYGVYLMTAWIVRRIEKK